MRHIKHQLTAAFLCLHCRRVFKKPSHRRVGDGYETLNYSPRCAQCRSDLVRVGDAFRAPPKDDSAAWKRVEQDIRNGRTFARNESFGKRPDRSKKLRTPKGLHSLFQLPARKRGVMQPNIPQSVGSRQGSFRCVRLSDGRFHLAWPGPLAHLFNGTDHILVSEDLAKVFRETCAHCLDLRRAEIVQVATGESFGIYFEVIAHDTITLETINKVCADGFHVWRFGNRHLFVTPAVADEIRKRGFDGISFSPGFSHFAAATA